MQPAHATERAETAYAHLHVAEHGKDIEPLSGDAGQRGAVEAPVEAENEEPVDENVPHVRKLRNVKDTKQHIVSIHLGVST